MACPGWNDFITNNSVREEPMLAALPLIVDHRQGLLSHIHQLPEETPAHVAFKHSVDSHGGHQNVHVDLGYSKF